MGADRKRCGSGIIDTGAFWRAPVPIRVADIAPSRPHLGGLAGGAAGDFRTTNIEIIYGNDLGLPGPGRAHAISGRAAQFKGPDEIIVDDLLAAGHKVHVETRSRAEITRSKVSACTRTAAAARRFLFPFNTRQDLIGAQNKPTCFLCEAGRFPSMPMQWVDMLKKFLAWTATTFFPPSNAGRDLADKSRG